MHCRYVIGQDNYAFTHLSRCRNTSFGHHKDPGDETLNQAIANFKSILLKIHKIVHYRRKSYTIAENRTLSPKIVHNRQKSYTIAENRTLSPKIVH